MRPQPPCKMLTRQQKGDEKLPIVLGALAVRRAAFAADDPIAARQAIMDCNGASAAVAGGMLKEEIPYSPAVGKAVIASLNADRPHHRELFPRGQQRPREERRRAQDPGGSRRLQAALAKFSTDVAAALQASGKDGPADKAAFQAAVQPVLGNCKTCHETFRLKN